MPSSSNPKQTVAPHASPNVSCPDPVTSSPRPRASRAARIRVPERATSARAPVLPLLLSIALLTGGLLAGCAPLLIGGAAVGTASTIYDRRSASAVLEDQQIELSAMSTLAQDPQVNEGARVSITSYNRTVLLTGQAQSADIARRAARLVSQLPKVARVIDEIAVGPRIGIGRQAEDSYITARAKTALVGLRFPGFDPTRVKVVTEDGVVYLMGLLSPEEAEATAEKVRYVPGVQRVVKLFEYLPARG